MASRVSQYRRAEPALVEQRDAPRHLVRIERVTARRHGDPPTEAVLHDLSIFGCRIETSVQCGPGDRLWLRFPGGLPIATTVIWTKDGFSGCRFDSPIAGALVRTLARTV